MSRATAQILGVLGAARRRPRLHRADERLLVNIAHLAALALRSARLFEERTRAYGELAAAQDRLVRTEKLRALGEMASGVAHDFNNVLAAIVGRSQLLLREVTDAAAPAWLEVIERSALDGANTVRRLQEFTRIRRDQPSVSVDLNRVVQRGPREHRIALAGGAAPPRDRDGGAHRAGRALPAVHRGPVRAARGPDEPDPQRGRRDARGRRADPGDAHVADESRRSPSPTPAWGSRRTCAGRSSTRSSPPRGPRARGSACR